MSSRLAEITLADHNLTSGALADFNWLIAKAELAEWTETEVKRLEEQCMLRLDLLTRMEKQLAELHKWQSQRRQRIRDGWNVEFDRETGHELWVMDDPPLEEKP